MLKSGLTTSIIAFAMTPAFASEAVNTHNGTSSITPLERLESLTGEGYMQLAVTCIIDGQELSGTQKICYYKCGGRTTAIKISVGSVCPRLIDG